MSHFKKNSYFRKKVEISLREKKCICQILNLQNPQAPDQHNGLKHILPCIMPTFSPKCLREK